MSVSGFIAPYQDPKFLENLQKEWFKPIIIKAQIRGTYVHKWSEKVEILPETPNLITYDDECEYFRAFLRKKEELGWGILAIELPIYSKLLKIAGTIDRLYYDPKTEEIILVDIKTGATRDINWYQQFTYKFILDELGVPVHKIRLLCLKDGMKLVDPDNMTDPTKKNKIMHDVVNLIYKREKKVRRKEVENVR